MLLKSMDWFLYDNGLRHERFKSLETFGNETVIGVYWSNEWLFAFLM